jgi:UDP-N-acetylmuramoyl-tripeptide--D-alanyl-D-alanine ligase
MIEILYQHFLNATGVSTDSRNIQQGQIFFALKGDNFDGNRFAGQAIYDGASLAVVSEALEGLPENKCLLVDDTLVALQQLATHHRKQWGKKVIALTGSNGKTTTKELVHSVLSTEYNAFATSGNLNNHIGVPLSLLAIKPEHDLAVIEMGANHCEEIKALCNIAHPDVGLITNIGKAHLEGFGGELGVLKGKTEMFDHLCALGKDILWNAADPKLATKRQSYKICKTYGTADSDVFAEVTNDNPTVHLIWNNLQIKTNLTGAYNAQNVMATICAGLYFGVSSENIVKGLEQYIPSNSRSQLMQQNGVQIILDAYNANPSSVAHALENLARIDQNGFFILGDMFELGDKSAEEHQAICDLAQKLNLEGIVVGSQFCTCSTLPSIQKCQTREGALACLQRIQLKGRTVLLKGSRGMKMETLLENIK